jgi:phosphate transport system ATP-binding protein
MILPNPPQALSLSVTDLSVHIGGKHQLKGISFQVPQGGAISITGPVNSGKSALLWAVNGLLYEVPGAKIKGRVQIDNIDLQQIPVDQLRQRVALHITAPLARTPFSEVALPLQGTRLADVGARVEHVLRLVGLWSSVRNQLHQPYSVSNPVLLRLLTLARTIVQEPGILLLDDPTRGLDNMGRARFEDAVANIVSAHKTTLVWATREPDQAGRIAETMAFLCNGEMIEIGPTASIFERPGDPRTESFLTGDYLTLQSLLNNNL